MSKVQYTAEPNSIWMRVKGGEQAGVLTLSSLWQEEMSGESVVTSAVPAAATRTTSFKGASPSSKYVKLNVGGALYYTTMQTLTKQDTMLKAMFSGRMEVLTDSEGEAPAIVVANLTLCYMPQTHLWLRASVCSEAQCSRAINHTHSCVQEALRILGILDLVWRVWSGRAS